MVNSKRQTGKVPMNDGLTDDDAANDLLKHRPWPLPAGPWVMAQRWHDLLFAHWPVPAADVRSFFQRERRSTLLPGKRG